MAFELQETVTREPHIRDLEITLHRTIDQRDHDYPQGIEYRLTIDDQFNHPMGHRSGDLVPHLTAGQISALVSFMDAMWLKAETEVIG